MTFITYKIGLYNLKSDIENVKNGVLELLPQLCQSSNQINFVKVLNFDKVLQLTILIFAQIQIRYDHPTIHYQNKHSFHNR